MPIARGHIASSLAFAALLLVSGTSVVGIGASPSGQQGANWYLPGGISGNWNYNPQSDVNSNNVESLAVKWILPIPAAPGLYGATHSEGVIVTPIIVNGIAYFITNWQHVYAVNVGTGALVWQKDLPLIKNYQNFFANLTGLEIGHYHNGMLTFTTGVKGTPLYWISSNSYQIFAYNALTGDQVLNFSSLTPAQLKPNVIQGNYGTYGSYSPNVLVDNKTGILVTGGASGQDLPNSGRGFIAGWDINSNPPRLLWRTFVMPPQDGTDPNWSVKSVQNLSGAYSWSGHSVVDWKKLSTADLTDHLYKDWGTMCFDGKYSYAGTGAAWGGSWAEDQQAGIVYVDTDQASPYNGSCRPGPNLWANSIMALDINTGKIIWAFQANSHDTWDHDCSWNVVMATLNIGGAARKVILKACKSGFLFALDAATGQMLWHFDSQPIKRTQYACCYDPLNKTQMSWGWPSYPSAAPFFFSYPFIESEISYNPVNNMVYAVANTSPNLWTPAGTGPGYGRDSDPKATSFDEKAFPVGFTFGSPPASAKANATVFALDALTGSVKWSYFLGDLTYRGGLSVSGNVLYVPQTNGLLRFLDATTGKILGQTNLIGPVNIQPSIGRDANGNVMVVQPVATSFFAAPVPGYVVAFGLPPAALQSTTTQVKTTTVVSSTSAPTGIDPATFYAAAGVAVIFVIATGILAVRRRRPAS